MGGEVYHYPNELLDHLQIDIIWVYKTYNMGIYHCNYIKNHKFTILKLNVKEKLWNLG